MPVERDGVPMEPRRFGPIAGLNLAKREMPAQMAMEIGVLRIGREPGGEETARRRQVAGLVADMGVAMGGMGIIRVGRDRSLDLRPGLGKLAILGQRQSMIGTEPEILAVGGSQPVRQGLPGRRGMALPHQDLRLAGMGHREAGIGGDRPLVGLEGAGIEGQRQAGCLDIGIPRGSRRCRQGKTVEIRHHANLTTSGLTLSSAACDRDVHRLDRRIPPSTVTAMKRRTR